MSELNIIIKNAMIHSFIITLLGEFIGNLISYFIFKIGIQKILLGFLITTPICLIILFFLWYFFFEFIILMELYDIYNDNESE